MTKLSDKNPELALFALFLAVQFWGIAGLYMAIVLFNFWGAVFASVVTMTMGIKIVLVSRNLPPVCICGVDSNPNDTLSGLPYLHRKGCPKRSK